jgi:hypothetical protein
MRLLLDTHLLLWALAAPQQLDPVTRIMLEEPENEVLFSAASIWEIAIKVRLGRADFPVRPEAIAQAARGTGRRPAVASPRSLRPPAGGTDDGRADAALHRRSIAAALFGTGDAGRLRRLLHACSFGWAEHYIRIPRPC